MKTFLLSLTLVSSIYFFAGCAPKVVETEPLRPVAQNSQGQPVGNRLQYTDAFGTPLPDKGDVSLNKDSDLSQKNPPSTLGAEDTQTKTEGPIMKTLADFQPITATEATITTNKGAVVIQLYPDKAPLTVTNFLTLAKSGFYNGIKFHRIIADFMAQVGDPLTKDDAQQSAWGTGGPGYTIQDEFAPDLKFDGEGVVAMANTGQPNTGGSQFFITFGDTSWLNGKHAIFGKVTQGMDVVRSLVMGDQIVSITFK
ncbi:hypothetical protein BH10PAT2_BH10PAT2_1290 [soil metagenome]